MKLVFCAVALGSMVSMALAQAPPEVNVRGKITKVNGTSFTVQSDSGQSTEVKEKSDFKAYERVQTDLSHVKDTSFIGVTTVKQPDGKERATEIHVFPAELRGAGEGSRMFSPGTGAPGSRMTNGAVSQSRMTNGAVSQSRMTNGAVANSGGGTMKVKYAGGEQDVVVPPDVKVTEIKQFAHKATVGDDVVVTGTKGANGLLEADRITLNTHP